MDVGDSGWRPVRRAGGSRIEMGHERLEVSLAELRHGIYAEFQNIISHSKLQDHSM